MNTAVQPEMPPEPTLIDGQMYRLLSNHSARIWKANDVRRERGIRLYCEQYGTSWNLQIRAPEGIGGFGLRDGKAFMIANASLSRADMKALRDAITLFLAQS